MPEFTPLGHSLGSLAPLSGRSSARPLALSKRTAAPSAPRAGALRATSVPKLSAAARAGIATVRTGLRTRWPDRWRQGVTRREILRCSTMRQ